MEMREVEAFLAVADHLHFGRAAEELRLTPSRVSQTIQTLERRVGGRLFERTSRQVRLTPLGQQLRAQWQPAYLQLVAGLNDARQAASGPVSDPLRVGYPATVPPETLDVLTGAYAAARPGRRILWLQDRLVDMYTWRPGTNLEYDVIIGWLPPRGQLDVSYLRIGPPIRRMSAALVVGEAHPLAGRSSVQAEELPVHALVQPEVTSGVGIEWVPATTPAGRALHRVTRRSNHFESLISAVVDDRLAHLTFAGLDQTPAWNLYAGRTVLVPIHGLEPFTLRAVWPATAATASDAEDFAELAARAGAAAGWLGDEPAQRARSSVAPSG